MVSFILCDVNTQIFHWGGNHVFDYVKYALSYLSKTWTALNSKTYWLSAFPRRDWGAVLYEVRSGGKEMAYVNSSALIADFQSQSDTGGHSGFYAEREKEALPVDPSSCFPPDRSCQASELSATHFSLQLKCGSSFRIQLKHLLCEMVSSPLFLADLVMSMWLWGWVVCLSSPPSGSGSDSLQHWAGDCHAASSHSG